MNTHATSKMYNQHLLWAALVVQLAKNLQETQVQSLGQEDPLEEGMAARSSALAWRISRTEEPGELQTMGSQRVGHNWATNTVPAGPHRSSLHLQWHYSQIRSIARLSTQFHQAQVKNPSTNVITSCIKKATDVRVSFFQKVYEGEGVSDTVKLTSDERERLTDINELEKKPPK